MQKDLSIILLYGELVFTEEFLVLLLFDLCHNVLSFLQKEIVKRHDFYSIKRSSDTREPNKAHFRNPNFLYLSL